jgi:hypothetical protein
MIISRKDRPRAASSLKAARWAAALASSISLLMFGCVGGDPAHEDDPAHEKNSVSTDGAGPTNATYSRTIVHLHGDGTKSVVVDTITSEDQAAEVAAAHASGRGRAPVAPAAPVSGTDGLGTAAQPLVAQDTSCGSSSFWIFDQVQRQGNEICFYEDTSDGTNAGEVFFSNYTRTVECNGYFCFPFSWSGAVRSYWPGSDCGGWMDEWGDGIEYFGMWAPAVDYADSTVQGAAGIGLDDAVDCNTGGM